MYGRHYNPEQIEMLGPSELPTIQQLLGSVMPRPVTFGWVDQDGVRLACVCDVETMDVLCTTGRAADAYARERSELLAAALNVLRALPESRPFPEVA